MNFDIIPQKYASYMNLSERNILVVFHHGGWYHKLTHQIAIFGTHNDILDYACTINHECLHQIVQVFVGEADGWNASSLLDEPQYNDFMNLSKGE